MSEDISEVDVTEHVEELNRKGKTNNKKGAKNVEPPNTALHRRISTSISRMEAQYCQERKAAPRER